MKQTVLRILAAALVGGLALGGATHPAAAAGAAEVKISQVDFSEYPRLPGKVFVSVTDSQGAPLKDLKKEDFTLTLDGQPLSISAVAGQDLKSVPTPIQLVLAIDTSQNMRGEPLEKALAAAKQFVGQLRPGDKVAIWKFADKPEEVQTFTDNTTVLKERLDSLKVGAGRTAINDTLFTISREVMKRQGRRALILVTQGKNDSTAKGNLMGGLAAAVDAQAPAYMLGFGQLDEESLATIARETGGEFLKEPAADGVGRLFTQLKELLQGQYELQADIPVEKVDGKEHSFAVSTRVGGRELKSTPRELIIVQTVPIPEIVRTLTARAKVDGGTVVPPDGSTGEGKGDGGGTASTNHLLPWILGLVAVGALLWFFMRPGTGPSSAAGSNGGWESTVVDPNPGVGWPSEAEQFPVGGSWQVPPTVGPTMLPAPMPGGPMQVGGLPGGTVIIRPVAKGILAAMDGPLAGQQHELTVKTQGNNSWEIGREGPQDLVLNDPTVSRRHAKLKWEWEGQGPSRGGHFVIYDLAAANPVEVNGQVVVQQALRDGDRIKIGASTFVFKQVEIQHAGSTR